MSLDDSCSKRCKLMPCEICSAVDFPVFDIASRRESSRTVSVSSMELNELILTFQGLSNIKIQKMLQMKHGISVPLYLIESINNGLELPEGVRG